MPHTLNMQALRTLIDKEAIREAICRYARAVDRGDWDQVRSAYHPDAYDEHGEYKGGIPGLIEWLDRRFDGVDNSMHFLGNCLIEFATPDVALVETYFVSRRLQPAADGDDNAGVDDAIAREGWGRYVDRFERRDGEWRVAHRTVVLEALSHYIALGGKRKDGVRWGHRSHNDRLYEVEREIFGVR
ncbi:nuclear transport factor 2 family protein [Paraburkholderia aromaticivorans]|uniref:nuclear transport factor 2 family protein n=1 Tax=Paraburkholderia aromaticivorans TaxID=2026199 RepID=UPI0014561C91|nr:nuclear transport factor 2 family protein [Paraburkholderia aromaticivorans]